MSRLSRRGHPPPTITPHHGTVLQTNPNSKLRLSTLLLALVGMTATGSAVLVDSSTQLPSMLTLGLVVFGVFLLASVGTLLAREAVVGLMRFAPPRSLDPPRHAAASREPPRPEKVPRANRYAERSRVTTST